MTKLCPRGKAAAKRKFAVYPSAYANAYASKICAGKIKDPSGTKRKDFKGPKPAAKGAMMNKPKGAVFGFLFRKKKKEKEADSKETKESLIKKNVGKKNKRLKELKDEIGMNKGGGADTGRIGELKSRLSVITQKLGKLPGRRLTSKDIERLKKLKPMKPLSRVTGGPVGPSNPPKDVRRDKDGNVIKRTRPSYSTRTPPNVFFDADGRPGKETFLKKQKPFRPDPYRKQDLLTRPGKKRRQYRPRPAGRPLPPPPKKLSSKPQFISRATGGMADYYKDLM